MKITLFTFNYSGKQYKVEKSDHTHEHRGVSPFHRDEFLNNKRYEEIFKRAFRYGLTSFRNKGPIVISFKDYNDRTYSILANLNEENQIFIISVYRGWTNTQNKNFIKESNRINLTDFVLPYMKPDERKAKQHEKLKHDIEKECRIDNEIFTQYVESEWDSFHVTTRF